MHFNCYLKRDLWSAKIIMIIRRVYIEELYTIIIIVLGYRVVFFNSFFISIRCFIIFSIGLLWWLLLRNLSFLALLLVIIYLRGLIVLFSYSFILRDVKVQFSLRNTHLILLFFLLLIYFILRRNIREIILRSRVREIYGRGVFILFVRRVLLYVVLIICLYLCLGLVFF